MLVHPEPLTAEAFASFGHVITPPPPDERRSLSDILQKLQPDARASLSLTSKRPDALPYEHVVMERHRYSSQAFLPLKASRYLVVVAPSGEDGTPDVARCRAFFARGGQGVMYSADTWHCPLTVLDQDAQFAVFIYLNGVEDEEFVNLGEPIKVAEINP